MSERPERESRLSETPGLGNGSGGDVRLVPPPRATRINEGIVTDRATGTDRLVAAKDKSRAVRWSVAAVVLGGALLAVFTLLPGWVDSRRNRDAGAHTPALSVSEDAVLHQDTTTIPPETGAFRLDAENVRDAVAGLRSSLQAHGVSDWAPLESASADRSIAAGDEYFKAGEYKAASAAYDQALQQFQKLQKRSDEVARQTREDGDRALAAGDSERAAAAFRLALQLEPDSRAAESGLRRAQVLDELMDLLGQARDAEQRGDLAPAADLYKRAAILDPQSNEARSGMDRVSHEIARDEFAGVMSAGLDALDREDWSAARAAFKRAATLRPDSPEVADGLARADAGNRVGEITEHQERASAFEQRELWESAAAEYESVLALDPAVAFARHGRDHALARARLGERIEFHLEHPDRLSSAPVLEEAVELLEHARGVSPKGPVLTDQIDRLEETIRVASTPIRVELVSDGLTDIVIYGVGQFGRLTRRSLQLTPGTYTVLGTRHGYRDVRIAWTVGPGMDSEVLVIQCEEEI